MLPRKPQKPPSPEDESDVESKGEEEDMPIEMDSNNPKTPHGFSEDEVDSPVTCLSGNFSQLSTQSQRKTPKRSLGLDEATESPGTSSQGVFLDSPTPIDSPSSEMLERNKSGGRKLRRVKSSPELTRFRIFGSRSLVDREAAGRGEAMASTSGGSGGGGDSREGGSSSLHVLMEEDESQDSGIVLDQDADFKAPRTVGSRRRLWPDDSSEEVQSPPRKTKAKGTKRSLEFDPKVTVISNTDGKTPVPFKRSAPFVSHSPSLPLMGHSLSDPVLMEFLEESSVPVVMASLKDQSGDPELKGLFQLMEEPEISMTSPAKDATPPAPISSVASKYMEQNDGTPVRQYSEAKRQAALRSQSMVSRPHLQQLQPKVSEEPALSTLSPGSLRRWHSASEASIKEAVHKMSEEPNLIADSSKMCLLPTISGKHQDLKTISHETMADLLNGRYAEEVEGYHIVDSRFPYEYAGGHIQNAVNLYQQQMLIDKYMKDPVKVKDPSKRFILIFHCEFSSERGPGLCRHLRACDRQINAHRYPTVYYPEIYVLEGGYSTFYIHHRDLCEPQNYIPMLHKDYTEEYAKYQQEKKRAGDKKGSGRSLSGSSRHSSTASRSLKL